MSSRICTDQKTKPSVVKILNAEEIKPDTSELDNETLKLLNMDKPDKASEANENESDEELKRTLALSVEEAKESAEFEEALKRSLVDF